MNNDPHVCGCAAALPLKGALAALGRPGGGAIAITLAAAPRR